MTHEEILQKLYDDTLVGNAPSVKGLVEQGLEDDLAPGSMLYDALIPSLEEVGARFERGDYFVPEMLIAARAMQGALDILRPLLAETGAAEADGRGGDRERRDGVAVGAEDGCGERRQAALELVDCGRVALRADRGALRRPVGRERAQHLAVRSGLILHTAAHPVRAADEVARVLLREVLDPERRRHAEVDRLAGEIGERAQRGRGELDETGARVAVGEAEEHGPRGDAAVAGALHEPAALERADEARRRALREAGVGGELADPERAVRLDDAREQLGGAVDRLRARLGRHSPYGGTSVPRLSSRHEPHSWVRAGRDPSGGSHP